eukprot:TRINITY_DN27411_c0_g2_i1.p1 TRINITY_DN27411_c0_g2~~TRINITY_DN27411_c0_g2_i1.p1  ORF type:complete len:257 (-),score=62.94 TRINITY_DN27411_c0_g2_i1:379-1149(-)
MIRVQIHVLGNSTPPGESPCIVGSLKELGEWDANAAVPCKVAPTAELPHWRSAVFAVDRSTTSFEFKLINAHQDITRWEEGENKSVLLPFPRPADAAAPLVVIRCRWGDSDVDVSVREEGERATAFTAAAPGNSGVGDGDEAGGGAACSGSGVWASLLDGSGMARIDTGMHKFMQAALPDDPAFAALGATGMHPMPRLDSADALDGADISFSPVVLNGKELSPDVLRDLSLRELHKLVIDLGPVVDAAQRLLAARR